MLDIITGKRRKRKKHYGDDYKIIKEKREREEKYIPIADRHIDGA
ncbi:MAG: hypothetical protein UE068_14145 [Paludibacteraceae bacterium]|nr:hypothetical protein [Paludibacteraceae bacterium]